MANSNLPYGEGVSIHRPPVFNGENYVYWKIRMRIFIEAIDIIVWDAIENGPYILMTMVMEREKNECLRAKSLLWYVDSGCSRHMTGDPSKFSSLKLKNEGFVTYGDNKKGKILGCGNIGNSSSSTLIENVLLVERLKHNLLSISQLSDKGFKIEFHNTCCLICDKLTK
uniref:Retrovirus-related Pol polyprotein from transposon TNT 1-94-like beta-barrel domain-containing protein n=1 Tax=Cajanus cajan TaxID=3821 RepID=A0A151QMP3_CAJCA|nr:hypothetical protein KK1_048081 [Cajanus cajan]